MSNDTYGSPKTLHVKNFKSVERRSEHYVNNHTQIQHGFCWRVSKDCHYIEFYSEPDREGICSHYVTVPLRTIVTGRVRERYPDLSFLDELDLGELTVDRIKSQIHHIFDWDVLHPDDWHTARIHISPGDHFKHGLIMFNHSWYGGKFVLTYGRCYSSAGGIHYGFHVDYVNCAGQGVFYDKCTFRHTAISFHEVVNHFYYAHPTPSFIECQFVNTEIYAGKFLNCSFDEKCKLNQSDRVSISGWDDETHKLTVYQTLPMMWYTTAIYPKGWHEKVAKLPTTLGWQREQERYMTNLAVDYKSSDPLFFSKDPVVKEIQRQSIQNYLAKAGSDPYANLFSNARG